MLRRHMSAPRFLMRHPSRYQRAIAGFWLAACAAVVVAVGCSKVPSQTQAQRPAKLANEQGPQVVRSISDKLGRWTSQVVAGDLRLSVLPGYTHVEIEVDSNKTVHCFVYEQPIAPGQALSRLRQAIAPGLDMHANSPLVLKQVNGEASLSLDVQYVTTLPPIEHGSMTLVVHPRTDFPLVCTFDAPSISKRERGVIDAFVANFSLTNPAKPVNFREIWAIERGAVLYGFRHVQTTKEGDAWLTLTRTSLIALDADTMETNDFVIRELEDNLGLRFAQWVETKDEGITAQGQIELLPVEEGKNTRSYRYAVRAEGEPMTGSYDVQEPTVGSFSWLTHDFDAKQRGSLWQLMPQLAAAQPSLCSWRVDSSENESLRTICLSCEPTQASTLPRDANKIHAWPVMSYQMNHKSEFVQFQTEASCEKSAEVKGSARSTPPIHGRLLWRSGSLKGPAPQAASPAE